MKIKVIETFGHETGCFVRGSEHVVADELGAEVVAAALAVEIVEAPKQPKQVKPFKDEGK